MMIKQFEMNDFNFRRNIVLRYTGDSKYRGAFTTRPIPRNSIVCLFPGNETYRFPPSYNIDRDRWARRSTDQTWLDKEEEHMILSDYAIRVSVLDVDKEDRETGYHWRILDPMATDDEFQALCAQVQYVSDPEMMMRLPDEWIRDTNRRATTMYANMRSMQSLLPKRSAVSAHRQYEFYINDVDTPSFFHKKRSPGGFPHEDDTTAVAKSLSIAMYHDGSFHFVTTLRDIDDMERSIQNITLILNREFDGRRHKTGLLMQRAMRLKIHENYPYMGAFINQPHEHETENVRFVDPHEWISMVFQGKCSVPDYIKHAINNHTEFTDLLQRQAIISKTAIHAGEELLVKYSRK